MARRYNEIKGLAEYTAKTIVSDEEQWKKFLHTAGHMYMFACPRGLRCFPAKEVSGNAPVVRIHPQTL